MNIFSSWFILALRRFFSQTSGEIDILQRMKHNNDNITSLKATEKKILLKCVKIRITVDDFVE